MSDGLPTPDAVLDTRGLYCPEPVMMMHNQVRDMAQGQVLAVRATDPATQRDVPNFCRFLGHTLLEEREEGDEFYYLIALKQTD
ncbi:MULTISPECIES: sulfurtransferase TusA [Zymobacter]|uniref:Predicted redox protein n=1 Tax=Zymobacter palmae TaxID=33074 RepID=A0A348HE96_9GAMM|nr:sulfurtransferase TusA [Zymobacter palmae]BBG29948.1 predicted redox protein [Zymobacter palmae]